MRPLAHLPAIACQAVIVASLWLVLWLLGCEISEAVALSTLGAVFGSGVVHS